MIGKNQVGPVGGGEGKHPAAVVFHILLHSFNPPDRRAVGLCDKDIIELEEGLEVGGGNDDAAVGVDETAQALTREGVAPHQLLHFFPVLNSGDDAGDLAPLPKRNRIEDALTVEEGDSLFPPKRGPHPGQAGGVFRKRDGAERRAIRTDHRKRAEFQQRRLLVQKGQQRSFTHVVLHIRQMVLQQLQVLIKVQKLEVQPIGKRQRNVGHIILHPAVDRRPQSDGVPEGHNRNQNAQNGKQEKDPLFRKGVCNS